MSRIPLYTGSTLAQQAEKLLNDDSLLSSSSGSDIDSYKPLRPSMRQSKKERTTASAKEKTLRSKSRGKKSEKQDTSFRSKNSATKIRDKEDKENIPERNRSKSVSRKNSTKTIKLSEEHHGGCHEQKKVLKDQVDGLEKTVEKQNKKLKDMYSKVLTEKDEIKKLANELYAAKKSDKVVNNLEEKVKSLQSNEFNLINELNEQHKVSKEALSKLYEIQEDSLREIERARVYYKELYQKRVEEERDQYESKIRALEIEKEQLNQTIRNLEASQNLDKTSKIVSLSNEITQLKADNTDKSIEIDRLRIQLADTSRNLQESVKYSDIEIKNLRSQLELVNEQNKSMKINEEEFFTRDKHQIQSLKQQLEDFEQELEEKDKIIKDLERAISDKDISFLEQLEQINEKVAFLQSELAKLTECELKIDELNRTLAAKDSELEQTKSYYHEKYLAKKRAQQDQKKEWSNIYNELISEIKLLKNEIDSLGVQNKQLLSSINGSTGRTQLF